MRKNKGLSSRQPFTNQLNNETKLTLWQELGIKNKKSNDQK